MSSFLKAKQTKFTAYAVVYTAVVLGALGLLNFLANRHNKSLDLTANKRFTLSDQTLKVANGLKEDVKIGSTLTVPAHSPLWRSQGLIRPI
jgi:ABC-type uncharacterized transport system involved in gliding motility auxiliary subunit